MDQTPTLRVVVGVVICCCLLSVDDVATLPLQPCSSLFNYVDSMIAAAQPLSADDLSLYLACIGVEQQQFSDDDAVRQLLALQPNSTTVNDVPVAAHGGWSRTESVSDEVCATVECLSRRAALTFKPCSRLTQLECSALVIVLENMIPMNSAVDNDASAARMLEHSRQLFEFYRKWRQRRVTDDGTRKKRHAEMMKEKADNRSDRNPRSVSKFGGNDKDDGRMSSRVTFSAVGPRMRRSIVPRGIPFQLPQKITPQTRAIVEAYLEWRAKNGYGMVSGRWG